MKVSIAIPTYEMHGRGAEMLKFCLKTIHSQTRKPDEVVISDHSVNDDVMHVCEEYPDTLIYFRNNEGRGLISNNLNSSIRLCTGDIIKIICQDDFLFDENSLAKIVSNFDLSKGWLVSSYYHTLDKKCLFKLQTPKISGNILFENLIGTPTGLTIRNKDIIYFDEKLNWYVDSDYYMRLYQKFGEPIILKDATAVQLLWEGQTSNTIISFYVIEQEKVYLTEKYAELNHEIINSN